MSYAQNNRVCASWHKAPEGWRVWTGNMSGYSDRGFCNLPAGHYGDHRCGIETIQSEPSVLETRNGQTYSSGGPQYDQMSWPNKTPGSWPSWMTQSTRHALRLLEAHPMATRAEKRAITAVLKMIEEVQGE